jgi:hypothetical protein
MQVDDPSLSTSGVAPSAVLPPTAASTTTTEGGTSMVLVATTGNAAHDEIGSDDKDLPPEFEPVPQVIETVTNFLIRVASIECKRYVCCCVNDSLFNDLNVATTSLPKRSLLSLERALRVWPQVVIKFTYFNRLFNHAQDNSAVAVSGLRILNVVLKYQMKAFVQAHVEQMQDSLKGLIGMDLCCDF